MVGKRLEENSEVKEKGRKVGVPTDSKEAATAAANTDTARSGVPKERVELAAGTRDKENTGTVVDERRHGNFIK